MAKTYQKFNECISKSLSNNTEELKKKRIVSAEKNSWRVRIEQMSDLIQQTIDKKINSPVNWQKNFVMFYRIARKKMLKFATVTLALYLLLFYTPFVWSVSAFLKIDQVPEEADCIVVFAGGVGESGRPGQGYEERVKHAVDLYKDGYSKHLVFSSGYSYVFEEPLVMKALAMSLGVPKEAITLEDKAKNTYENVIFVKKILDENNWDKILLVSAPYHMRRVSLVAKKSANKITIIYTPIKESRFYQHGKDLDGQKVWKQISLFQIKALMHEYLGIVYYWQKGYI